MLLLIREGSNRSVAFKKVVDAIDASDGIVYVEFGICEFGHWDGCLMRDVRVSGRDRYLRIIVTPDRYRRGHDRLIALIAHELQHASEVLADPRVVDSRTMEEMFHRIGVPEKGSPGYETSAAHAVENAVLSELLGRRRAGFTVPFG